MWEEIEDQDVKLFGQVRAEYKCLKLDSNPSLTANSFLLNIILCYISEKSFRLTYSFKNILDSKVISRLKYHLAT